MLWLGGKGCRGWCGRVVGVEEGEKREMEVWAREGDGKKGCNPRKWG